MKKYFFILSLFSLSTHTVLIKFPDYDKLIAKVWHPGFIIFNNRTHIIEELANQTIEANAFATLLEFAMHDFRKYMRVQDDKITYAFKKNVCELLLNNNPIALKEVYIINKELENIYDY